MLQEFQLSKMRAILLAVAATIMATSLGQARLIHFLISLSKSSSPLRQAGQPTLQPVNCQMFSLKN